jgi:phage repressor protein C with HTH and peptisase S24 domain
LFRRRIGGVFVVVVEEDLGEHVHKKLFSQNKKISLLDDNKG